MTTRSERLQRLTIASPCTVPWESMSGDGAQRHCAHCRRHVVDVAQLTPRQVEDVLQASHGSLCMRLTHRDGMLVTASAPPWLDTPASAPRSLGGVAAGLLTAWLATTSVEARAMRPPEAVGAPTPAKRARTSAAAERPRVDTSASLTGRVLDVFHAALPGVTVTLTGGPGAIVRITDGDGRFAFTGLAAGAYEVQAELEGFSTVTYPGVRVDGAAETTISVSLQSAVSETISVGVGFRRPEPLRDLYDESDLIAVGVLGNSRIVDRDRQSVTVLTEIRPESLLLGARRGSILYRHTEWDGSEDYPSTWRSDLAPGKRVLAFLKRSDDFATAGAFEDTDPGFGVMRLSDAERSAYVARLHALATIEGARRDGGDPDAIVEWLVATAEDPVTRGEATYEIQTALDHVEDLVRDRQRPRAEILDDIRDEVLRQLDGGRPVRALPAEALAPFLTLEQRNRLTDALATTHTLGNGDRELAFLVLRWEPALAISWLSDRLEDVAPPAGDIDLWWLEDLAGELGDTDLPALLAAARTRVNEIYDGEPGHDAAAMERIDRLLAPVALQLRHDAARVLAERR